MKPLFEPGIYKFNKPLGWTSFDVVNWVKHRTANSKVGHAGTLDPAAEGLLIVAVGRQNTRNIEAIIGGDKEYIFEITFGIVTDTYDREGTITGQTADFSLTREQVEQTLRQFIGPQKQVPPMYSAIKKDGRKLYELARKGIEVVREPKDIVIHELELLSFDRPKANLRTVCSKGTYVRSLCYDIGQRLGMGAYMSKLKRTRIGHYTLDNTCLIPVSERKK